MHLLAGTCSGRQGGKWVKEDGEINSSPGCRRPGGSQSETIKTKTLKTSIRISKDRITGIESVVKDLISQKPQVRVKVKSNKVSFQGPVEDVQYLANEFAKTQASDGNQLVQVVEGDIACQNVDVIVNFTHKSSSFDGSLSTHFFEKAGVRRDDVYLVHSDIQYTSPGDLSCRVIFNVVIPKCNKSMKNMVMNVLKRADKLELSTIAIPAIGAGYGTWKGKDVSAVMQAAFLKFERDNNNMKLIKVVLHPLMSPYDKMFFYMNVGIKYRRGLVPGIAWKSQLYNKIIQSVYSRISRPLPSKFERATENDYDMAVISSNTENVLSLAVAGAKNPSDAITFMNRVLQAWIGNFAATNDKSDSRTRETHEITNVVGDMQEPYIGDDHVESFANRNDFSFESFCQQIVQNRILEEIRFVHGEMSQCVMRRIATAIDCSRGVEEFELRDSAVTVELLQMLCHNTPNQSTISELSITGEDDILALIPVICKIVKLRATKSLCLTEDNLTDESLLSLKENLSKITTPTLSSLDISNNERISDYATLADVLNLCNLSDVRLLDCGVTPKRLCQLGNGLENKLARLDLSFNADMDVDCFKLISRLLKRNAEFLGLSECDITKGKALTLFQNLVEQDITLNILDMSYNCDLRYSGVSVISGFMKMLKLRELSLAGCNLDLDCVVTLGRNLKGHKLTKLDLSDNSPLHDEGLKILGRMVEECPIENLDLSNCALSSKQIDILSTSLGESKISKLNISDDQITLDSSMMEAIITVTSKVDDELTLCYENAERFIHHFTGYASQIPRVVYRHRHPQFHIEQIRFVPKLQNKAVFL